MAGPENLRDSLRKLEARVAELEKARESHRLKLRNLQHGLRRLMQLSPAGRVWEGRTKLRMPKPPEHLGEAKRDGRYRSRVP